MTPEQTTLGGYLNLTPYLPVSGTWGEQDGWVTREHDPFTAFMRSQRFEPLRQHDGTPFTWSSRLNGWHWFERMTAWKECRDKARALLITVPYVYRNVIAHSHGGQGIILLAADGFPIRSLTTIGTPYRRNMPIDEAAQHVAIWQHFHDLERDWVATLRPTLGQIGDRHVALDRKFDHPRVLNIGLPNISHSKLLKDPRQFHWLVDSGALDRIRSTPLAS